MKKSKVLGNLFVLVLCLMMVMSTGAYGEGADQPAKSFVILQCRAPSSPAAQAVIKTVEQYQAEVNPNFTVEYQYIPEMVSYKQKIKTLIASNEMPDMFSMDTDPYALTLFQAGYLKDITETCEKHNIADLYYDAPFKWGAFSDGTQIGLPAGMDIEMFWYNTELFEQAGVSVPATMDEFLEVCETLKQKGITPISMSGKEPWTVLRYFTMMSFRLEGNDYINGLVRGNRSMSEETGVKVLEFVQSLGVNGYFQADFASTDMAGALDYFLSGNAAMYNVGTWELDSFQDANLNENMKGKVDYFLLPNVEGSPTKDNEYIAHGGTPFCFAAETFDEVSEDFLVFFAKNYGTYLDDYTFSPNVDRELPNDTALTLRVAEDMATEEGAVRLVDVDADPATNTLMNKEIISLVLGETTIEAFCNAVDASIQENAPAYFGY